MTLSALLLEGEPAAGGAGNSIFYIIMIVVMFALVYFMFIRPQKKQEKEAANMRDNLCVGDEITTIGGIIGQVVSIKGETITIVTSKDKTKIRFLKTAIRSVDVKVNAPAPTAPTAPVDDKAKKSNKKLANAIEKPAEAPTETPSDVSDEAQSEENK